MRSLFTRGNVAYAAFMLLFSLALLEIGGRWYLSSVLQKSSERKFQFDPYRIYSHVPGFQEHDDNGPRLTINSQGFRRTSDVIDPKPAGTIRIFFMGGSAAHGISSAAPYPIAHVRDSETVDAYLEQMLAQRFPDRQIEVINAAVTGYQVFQHTAYILSELINYDPDLVIFFDGYNDHFRYFPSDDLYRDNIYQFWTPRLQDPHIGGVVDHFMLWASNFSGFARGYFAWKSNRDAEKRGIQLTNATRGWNEEQIKAGYVASRDQGYLRSITHNLTLLQYHDIDAIICLQPGLLFRNKDLMSTVEREELMPYVDQPFRHYLLPLVITDLGSITEEFQVPFLNFQPAFNSKELAGEQLFLDYCHLSPLGGMRAAEVLLPEVERTILARIPSTAVNAIEP